MNLKKALQQLNKFSGHKSIAICDYLLLKNGKLTSTDLEVFVEAKVPFEGEALIPVDKLKRIADKNEITNLAIQNGFAIVSTPKGQFKIEVESNVEDFPTYSDGFDKSFYFALDKEIKDLKDIARKDGNNALEGLYFSENGFVVATDAHKLKWLNRGVTGDKVVSPTIFKLPNGDYEMSFSGSHCRLDGNGVSYVLNLIDLPFPNYKAVIPTADQNPIRFECDKHELIEQLENCLIAANEVTAVTLNTNGRLSSSCVDYGTEYSCEIDCTSNELMEIGFCINNLLPLVKAERSNEIVFKIRDENSAVLINNNSLIMPAVITN